MIRLRQVVFAAAQLGDATSQLESTLGLGIGFHDPGVGEFGLVNSVYPVGEQFVEVVSPDPGRTAETAVDRFLDRNGGPGGYMLILQTDRDLGSVRADLADVRIVYEAIAPGVVGLHLHPSDVGGAIVSIDRTDDFADWPWAGPHWRDGRGTAPRVDGIAGVDIAVPDPIEFATRWHGWFGGEIVGTSLALDCGTDIAFAPGPPDGRGSITGFRFRSANTEPPFDAFCVGVRCTAD